MFHPPKNQKQEDSIQNSTSNVSRVDSADLIHIDSKSYQLHGLLGKGGQGEVYKVSEVFTGTGGVHKRGGDFALKCVSARSESQLKGYMEEVYLLDKFKGHPNIIQIHGHQVWGSLGV